MIDWLIGALVGKKPPNWDQLSYLVELSDAEYHRRREELRLKINGLRQAGNSKAERAAETFLPVFEEAGRIRVELERAGWTPPPLEEPGTRSS
jgi:hypothetical protein